MPVASIVAEIAADVRQYTAGLRKGAKDTAQFVEDVKRATSNVRFVDEAAAAKQAANAAKLVTGAFDREFSTTSADLREALFRGALNPAEFRKQGAAAAKAYNDQVLARMRDLAAAGELTRPVHQALVDSLKDAGLKGADAASRAANAHPLLGNLTTQGQRAAQSLLNGFGRTYDAEMLQLREKFARGLISKDEYERAGRAAAAAYNTGVGAGLDALRAKGKATQAITEALVSSFKDAGDRSGHEFRNSLLGRLTALSGEFSTVGRGLQDIGRRMTLGVSAPIAGLAALAVKIASDAGEAASKMEATFGGATEGMNRQLEALKRTVPETMQTLQDAAGDTFALVRGFGAAVGPARNFSVSVVKLAADIASFRNMRFADALRDVSAGIRGEAEPVAKFGADIREAALQQEALRTGLIKQGETLTAVGRAQVAFNIIQRATAPAIGDAARTATSAANQFKFLRRDATDAAQALGRELLPIILPMVAQLTRFVRGVADVSPGLIRWGIAIAAVAAAIGPLLTALGTFARILGTVGQAIRLLNAVQGVASLAGSFAALGLTLATGGALIAGLALLYFWLNRNADKQRELADATRDYEGKLAGATRQQIVANRVALIAEEDRLRARITSLNASLPDQPETKSGLISPAAQRRLDELDAVKAALERVQLAERLTDKAWTDSEKSAAATARATADAAKQIADATNAGVDPNAGKKTALERMAEGAKSALEQVQALRASTGATQVPTQHLLDTWVEISDAARRLGSSSAKGADALRAAVESMAKDPAIQFFFAPHNFDVRITPQTFDAFNDFGARVSLMLATLGTDAGREIARNLAAPITDATQAAIEAGVRQATVVKLPGLAIAQDVKVQLETHGVSGAVTRLALDVGRASDRMRTFANTTFVLAPFASAIKRLADVVERTSGGLANLSAAFADPATSLRTVLSGLGRAVDLTARGMLAAARGIASTVLSALNPLNVFRSFAEKIGQALQPALSALEGPLGKLAAVVADGLTPVFQALQPVVDALVPVIRDLFNAIGPILVALAPVLRVLVTLLDAVMPIIKLAAIAFTYLGQVVFTVASALSRFFGNLIIGFGKVIEVIARAVDRLPFVSAKGAIAFAQGIQDMGHDMLTVADEFKQGAKDLGDAREQIKKGNFMDIADGSAAAADGLNKVADSANQVTESLKNVPEGFRVALARFRAQAPAIAGTAPQPVAPPITRPPFPGGASGVGNGAAPVTAQAPVYVLIADSDRTARAVYADLLSEAQRQASAATGQSNRYAEFLPGVARASARRATTLGGA